MELLQKNKLMDTFKVRVTQRYNGILILFDKFRNIMYRFTPSKKQGDAKGVSTAVKSIVPRLESKDVTRLAKRLQALEKDGKVKWSRTKDYLQVNADSTG